MAHVGKYLPALMSKDLCLANNQFSYPPYRVRMITTNFSTGTALTAWRNQDIVSDEPTINPMTRVVTYRISHPSLALTWFEVDWVVTNNVPGSSSDIWNISIVLNYRFFWPGAHGEMTNGGEKIDIYLGAHFIMHQWTTFATSSNRSVIDKLNDVQFCGARWEDVPDYRPRQPDPIT